MNSKWITICPNCETKYTKNKWLIGGCPNCKGNNLKHIKEV